MEKLIRGILDFRKNILPEKRETFARLAEGQAPDVLFVTCSDSRVAPNWFASTNPGDLFVVRNVGNIIPKCNKYGQAECDYSVAAAIDFALTNLKVTSIVVCGHSGCGAVHAKHEGLDKVKSQNLKNWLGNLEETQSTTVKVNADSKMSVENQLSQQNVLQQIENLKTYPKVREKFESGQLRLHPWWFDIGQASVYCFDEKSHRFVLIDEKVGEALLSDPLTKHE